jgi:23S rRNA (adenine2503-C2)-methyltransferase
MGCAFCASGIGGFKRQLAPSEILGQIYAAQRDLGLRISRIVLMGMGEPLDNFDNVMRFLELVSDEKGLNIGMRHISLSTSGIVPRIYDLLEKDLQLTLSVSLHAPNDEIRSRIMPVNKSWNVDELLKACRIYGEKTSRRISFEYAMMKGVNDTPECARELGAKLKGILCHINLIPANEVPEKGHERSSDNDIQNFKNILERSGHTVTIRRTLGSDINASCGQLRREKMKEDNA